MTRDQAIKLVLMRCGMRQNDKTLQEAAVEELAMVQQTRLERSAFKPWFILSETESTVTFPMEERIPLPRNFLQEYEEGALYMRHYDDDREDLPGYVPPEYIPIVKDDYDHLVAKYPQGIDRWGRDNSPKGYAVVGNYITLHPAPQGTFMLKMKYYKRADTLLTPYGTGTEWTNEWLTVAPDWVIGELGAIIAGSYIKDTATQGIFAAQAAEARQAIYTEHVARDEANRSRSMGDD